jgi:hypothetical protein
VNGQDSQAEIFDVFLCHNSEDKPAVREIAQQLIKEGVKPWLDVEQIPPGSSWQTELGEQIKSIKSAAVFVGNSGIGPWQNEEIHALLSQFIERKCPVIPTILCAKLYQSFCLFWAQSLSLHRPRPPQRSAGNDDSLSGASEAGRWFRAKIFR